MNQKVLLFFSACFFIWVLSACTEVPVPTATPVTFNPTPAVKDSRVPSNSSATSVVTTRAGDPTSGENLFINLGCNACHSTGEDKIIGPGLKGVFTRAQTRSNMPSEDYLTQSIMYPGEYLVEGYDNLMPTTFSDLPESDLKDIISYLKTLD